MADEGFVLETPIEAPVHTMVPAEDPATNIPAIEPAAETPADAAPAEPAAPVEDDRSWQSKYDKLRAESDANARTLERYNQVSGVVELIYNDPEILSIVEQRIGGNSAPAVAAPAAAPSLERPVRPVKPANFSLLDAENDPESPSAKYLGARDAYQDAMLEYADSRAAAVEARQKQQEQAAREQQELQRFLNTVEERVVKEFGGTAATAKGFTAWGMQFNADTPEGQRIMYEAYLRETGQVKAPEVVQQEQRAAELTRRAEVKNQVVVPPTEVGGDVPKQEQRFVVHAANQWADAG